MFYSHTFLARKGPLGTVWCAAHLQHKLKKSHYTSTDISSTVERIIYPEVPIALRMSGHLLLGVVRIYSKKVDYLYQDCNVILISIRKAFSSVEINLPEDQAPFHSITLPDTFELDTLDLDDYFNLDGFQDNHLKSWEDITLTGQIPAENDPYIVITLDEDVSWDSSHFEAISNLGARTMEEDYPSLVSENVPADFQDAVPSNQTGFHERPAEDTTLEDVPEIEGLRDAVHTTHLENIPGWPEQENDILEPDNVLEQQIMNEIKILSPVAEEKLDSAGHGLSSQQPQEPPSASNEQTSDTFDAHIAFEIASPNLALRSSPPDEQPKVRPRKRRRLANEQRRHTFDKHTVLTNNFMKKALEDSSDLRRTRKDCPCSALGLWKLNKRLRKENIFSGSIMTGLHDDLSDMHKEDSISRKSHLVTIEKAPSEHGSVQSPASVPELDLEIERLRNYEGTSVTNLVADLMMSPFGSMPSPSSRNASSPAFTTNRLAQSDCAGTSTGTEVQPTPDLAASTGPFDSEMRTPMTLLEERLGVEHSGLFDIPELNSAGELNFLDEDGNSSGSRGTPDLNYSLRRPDETIEVEALSVRTRAVAQYLKRQSSATPISEGQSKDLSLNKILEGKSRKVCSHMFFETLVLKNCGFVDVQQEEPYHDIMLKLTPRLSKEQF